jgi:hypothetical protein
MGDGYRKAVGSSTNPWNSPPRERREWIRHTLRDPRGTLSWDEETERVTCKVTVVNISGGGAAALAERAPTHGQTLWLRLEADSSTTAPLEARLVETSAGPSGKQLVRLRFTSWVCLDRMLEQNEERRLWQRYPARETRATLTWIHDEHERTVRGELLNISGGGAAVVIDAEPPADKPISFGLESKGPTIAPVESRVVVISLDASGLKIARLRFVDSCPMALFELAVHGSS